MAKSKCDVQDMFVNYLVFSYVLDFLTCRVGWGRGWGLRRGVGVGVLPSTDYTVVCHPEVYGFWASLVWIWVYFLSEKSG